MVSLEDRRAKVDVPEPPAVRGTPDPALAWSAGMPPQIVVVGLRLFPLGEDFKRRRVVTTKQAATPLELLKAKHGFGISSKRSTLNAPKVIVHDEPPRVALGVL
jgi:hypothetical protein